ncbi:hypothetical protein L7Q71_09395, partial [Pseudomonas aeruginosa]|nr:hypothetical protein [Pseudomonas aeruginosa]
TGVLARLERDGIVRRWKAPKDQRRVYVNLTEKGQQCFVSVTGLLGANCIASLLALYPGQAGAASAVAVSGQFGLGCLASLAVGWLALPGVLPMALVMAVCGVGSLLALGLALHGGNR